MKIGHRIKGVEVIPYIPFVVENLPKEKDLKWFQYDIKRLKPAKDLILKFYEEASLLNLNFNIEYVQENLIKKEGEALQFKPVSRGKFCQKCKVKHLGTC
jgi:hypothetical protein